MLTFRRFPDSPLAALSAEMDRLAKDLVQPGAAWSYGVAPAADVLETEGQFRVVLDLPGLDAQSIQVDVKDETLSVKAARRAPAPLEGESVHRRERTFGTYYRAFTLPKTVDASRVEARYEQGVLTVVLPKRDEARPRTIQVKVG